MWVQAAGRDGELAALYSLTVPGNLVPQISFSPFREKILIKTFYLDVLINLHWVNSEIGHTGI